MSAPFLRGYQLTARPRINDAAGRNRNVLVTAPTGSGKGIQIGELVASAVAKGNKVIIGVPKIELVRQTLETLEWFGIEAGVIAAGYPERPQLNVQVASIATLTRRLPRWAEWRPDLLLIDECHHVIARSWHAIIEGLSYRRLIGFTGTPVRLDGKGLSRVFGEIVIVATVKQLVVEGWLSPVKVFAAAVQPDLSTVRVRAGDYVAGDLAAVMNQARFVGDLVEEFKRHCRTGPAVVYGANIAHSEALAAGFVAAGYRAQHVDAETRAAERAAAVAALGSGGLELICNVGLFTEGLDLPSLTGVLLARPTLSETLYLQMCGRAMRPAPGKEFAAILDHCGLCFRFGLPDSDREWSLEDRPKKQGRAPVRRCPECGLLVPLATWVCPECGCVLRTPEVAPVHAPGELVEAQAVDVERERLRRMTWRAQMRWASSDYERLLKLADTRGYRKGWAFYEQRRVLGIA